MAGEGGAAGVTAPLRGAVIRGCAARVGSWAVAGGDGSMSSDIYAGFPECVG